MSESTERKRRPNRLDSMALGAAMFLLGLLIGLLLSRTVATLIPSPDWPQELALVGIIVPLLFTVWRKYRAGRKNEIGYIVFGGLVIGVGLWEFFKFALSVAPPN